MKKKIRLHDVMGTFVGLMFICSLIIQLCVIVSIICIFSMSLTELELTHQQHLNHCKCCDNKPCSDTYYDIEKDLCILTLSGNTYKPNNNSCELTAKTD